VDEALDYLERHHHEPGLSLQAVAAFVGCNGRYLTHLFTQAVGQRMRGYLVGLRVERVCRELLRADRPIKKIALDAGFRDAGQLARAFHRHVGVTPGAYRRIFGGG
jgi:AraC-like DNA-binding protein